ncbi:MAG: ABC transporter permease [Clostridium sp.]
MKEFLWSKKNLILSIIFFCLAWQIGAIIINNELYLPRIESVLKESILIIKDKDFLIITLSTLYRTIISFVLALILAGFLGVISVISPLFNDLMKPISAIGKTIPTMVLVVLALIWFDKNSAPYVVGFAIVFPIIYEGIISSIKGVDKKLIQMSEVYEASHKTKIKRIYIPVIKNYLMGIMVSTFSLAFKVVVAGEVHGQPKYGIGAAVQLEKVNFNTPGIFSWILIIAIISILFEMVNKLGKRRVYKWKKEIQ